jgi:hypothetical protein
MRFTDTDPFPLQLGSKVEPLKLTQDASEREERRLSLELFRKLDFGAGWTRWNGGKCPLVRGQQYEAFCRDGSIDVDVVDDFDLAEASRIWTWEPDDPGADIVAYRLNGITEAECRQVKAPATAVRPHPLFGMLVPLVVVIGDGAALDEFDFFLA